MTGPGEAYAQKASISSRALSELTDNELLVYRSAIQAIANNEKISYVDDIMPGLTSLGKLRMINTAVKERKLDEEKSNPENITPDSTYL